MLEALRRVLRDAPDHEFGNGATREEVNDAERVLGVRFPESYRNFLKEFGWAVLGHREICGLGDDVPPHLDLVRVTQSERQEAHPHLASTLIPVMNDGGGNLYCLDAAIGTSEEYPVVLWDHELGEGQQPEVISTDFTTWLMEELAT